MPETIAGLAKVETQLSMVLSTLDRDAMDRKELYHSVHETVRKIDRMDYRLQSLEEKFANASPTIAEFITIKHKVEGAGMLGKALWAFGGFILAAAAWMAGIFQWLMGK